MLRNTPNSTGQRTPDRTFESTTSTGIPPSAASTTAGPCDSDGACATSRTALGASVGSGGSVAWGGASVAGAVPGSVALAMGTPPPAPSVGSADEPPREQANAASARVARSRLRRFIIDLQSSEGVVHGRSGCRRSCQSLAGLATVRRSAHDCTTREAAVIRWCRPPAAWAGGAWALSDPRFAPTCHWPDLAWLPPLVTTGAADLLAFSDRIEQPATRRGGLFRMEYGGGIDGTDSGWYADRASGVARELGPATWGGRPRCLAA